MPAEIILDNFTNGLSAHWKHKKFKDATRYTVQKQGDRVFLESLSSNAASGLYYDIDYSPRQYPLISWTWKIDQVLAKGNALTKEGDDYSARVYVIFPSRLFWRTKAINYIWANRLPQGTHTPSAYTSNSMMIALQSGNKKSGQWQHEQRNIIEDYRMVFGGDPPNVGSIAIMTDTDNTGGQARAAYGPIRLHSE